MRQKILILTVSIIHCAFAVPSETPDAPLKGEEVAILTDAPFVPPPITRDHPTRVKIEIEVTEVVKRMADGVDYTFWTFGGSVPGKFIHRQEGLGTDPAKTIAILRGLLK